MRIYISSTSELRDHREAVIAALRRAGHTPVCMEDYPAQDRPPVDKCLQDVAASDAYVGLLAWRYGSVPEGYGRSFTELEYRRAVEARIPTLIFLLDDSVSWPENRRDSGEASERIKALRQELKLSKTVAFFTNPDHLASEVLAAVACASPKPMPESCFVSADPWLDPSYVARDITEQVATELRQGARRIVLFGPAGVGKSRIVAGLFGLKDSGLPRMLWFRGRSVDDLDGLAGLAGELVKSCIVFDEDHQERRDRKFFSALLKSARLTALSGPSRVLLVLRKSTYEALRHQFDRFVPIEHAGIRLSSLDAHQAWSFSRAFTRQEKKRIADIAFVRAEESLTAGGQPGKAKPEKDRLLLPILVHACVRVLKTGRKLSAAELKQDDVRDQIYNLMMGWSGCDDQDRCIMAGLALSLERSTVVPSYYVVAILHSCGVDTSPAEVDKRLVALRSDGLVTHVPVPPLEGFAGWRFSNDLYYDSARSRVELQLGTSAIPESTLVAAAVRLADSSGLSSPEALAELGRLYTALVAQFRNGQVQVAQALIDAGERQVARGNVERSAYAMSLARVVRWVERLTELHRDQDFSRSLYDACCVFAGAISGHVTLRATLGLELGAAPIMGVGHALARLAFEAGLQEETAFYELAEARIEQLRSIGERCTSETEEIPTEFSDELYQVTRYAEMLMWARRFGDAADVCWRFLIQSLEEPGTDLCGVLRLVDLVAVNDMEAGDKTAAAQHYRQAANLIAQVAGMRSLSDLFSDHAAALEKAAQSGETADWPLLMRSHADALQEWWMSAPLAKPVVAVIGNYPEMPVASLLAEAFAREQVDARLVYSEIVAKLDGGLRALPKGVSAVLVGLHQAAFMNALVRSVASEEQRSQMMLACGEEPKYGRIPFTVDGRQVLWVGGWYPWQTNQAVRALIEDEGYMAVLI